jgi:hypothetical protein
MPDQITHDFGVLSSSRNRQFAVLSFSQCDHTSSKATVDSDTSLRSSIWVRVFSQGCLQGLQSPIGFQPMTLQQTQHPDHWLDCPANPTTQHKHIAFSFALGNQCQWISHALLVQFQLLVSLEVYLHLGIPLENCLVVCLQNCYLRDIRRGKQ